MQKEKTVFFCVMWRAFTENYQNTVDWFWCSFKKEAPKKFVFGGAIAFDSAVMIWKRGRFVLEICMRVFIVKTKQQSAQDVNALHEDTHTFDHM